MNKLTIMIALLTSLVFMSSSPINEEQIKWLTWQEAVAMNETEPKKIFVDVYTSWCGWCKRMDKTTFKDKEVAAYMNEHFYAVKLDAEMKDEITFRNQEFKYVKSGSRGIHTLAYSLLEGKMSYPTFVTLDEYFERIAVMPGYKKKDQFLRELRFTAEEMYKNQDWSDYNED